MSVVLAYALVGIFCAVLVRDDDSGKGLISAAVILSGTGLACHGLIQSLFRFGPEAAAAATGVSEAVRARIESGRAVAQLGLPGALGGFLAISIPLTLSWSVARDRSRSMRAAGLVLMAVQLAGLAATRSAAAVGSLAVASAVVLWLRSRTVSPHRATLRRIAAGILVIGIAAAVILLAVRLSSATAEDEGSGPLALRAGNWRVALEILRDHPVLGAGAGCYGIVFPSYRAWGMNESRFAHNTYLQVFAEGGLALGIPLLVATIVLTTLLVRRARDRSPYLVVSCLAFLIHNAVDFTFYLPTVGFAFACVAGFAIGPPARRSRPAGAWHLFRVVAALMLAAFVLMVGRADAEKQRARDLLEMGRGLTAIAAARESVARNPIDSDSHWLMSRLLFETAARRGEPELLDIAEAAAVEAVRLDPRTPFRWQHLGRVRLARSDRQGAYIALHRAAELYPIKIEYRNQRDAVAAAIAESEEAR